MPSNNATESDDISVDSDVAFAYMDFTGVDFGDSPKAVSTHQQVTSDELDEILATQRAVDAAKSIQRKYEELPGGQDSNTKTEEHDIRLFAIQERRVQNLSKWYELGIRPSLSSDSLNRQAHIQDTDLFQSKHDDLSTLLLRSLEAQDQLNTNLPPHPLGKHESQLKIAPSTIPNAGNGLFTKVKLTKGETICYYTGYRHDYQSQKRLKDRTYVLKLQNGYPTHNRRNDGFVDALPCPEVLARYINDPRLEERCNVKFEHVQQTDIWYCPVVALRDVEVGEELFVSYGPRYWEESRMIGG